MENIERLKYYMLFSVVLGLLLAVASLIYAFNSSDEKSYDLALEQAKNSFKKDLIFKQWVAKHDDMYTYITDKNQPTEFLSHIPNRDITSSSGDKLTLVNPTASLREMMKSLRNINGVEGKLTSLTPLNPENKPDSWETTNLKAFQEGKYLEKDEVVEIDNKDYMRYMKVLKANAECFKCHYNQDKSIGSVRGGLSILVPMDDYYLVAKESKQQILISHLVVVLIALVSLYLSYKQLRKAFLREAEAQKENEFHKQQLQDQDKLAQMGEMIGNIAHQWRQPLSAISTAASGMKVQKDLGMLNDDSFAKYLDGIVSNTQFLSETINTFTDYIKEKHDFKTVILQDRIDHVMKIIESSLDHHYITVKNDIDYTSPIKISMVIGELSQVLMNILNNAKEVLERQGDDNKDKTISVSLKRDGAKAVITIEDNAGGIPDDIFPKIFDPYFTTKHQSQGTGLGLYMSREIIMKHLHGKLYAQNSESGAKFIIELPIDNRTNERRKETHLVSKERREEIRREADREDD